MDFEFNPTYGDMSFEELIKLLTKIKEKEKNAPPFYLPTYSRSDGYCDYLSDLISDIQYNTIPLGFHFGYDYRTGNLEYVRLLPEDKKESDRLNDYSKILYVENPECLINAASKYDLESSIPADDFHKMQVMSKILSKYVFADQDYLNIFHVLANMTKLFFNCNIDMEEVFDEHKKPVSVQRFLDYNKIHGRERNMFYEFISNSSTAPGSGSSWSCISVSPTNCRTEFFIPRKMRTLLLYTSKKIYIVTLYNPQEFISYAACEYRFFQDKVILQDPRLMPVSRLMEMLRSKDIELYQYRCEDNKESIVFRGQLTPVEKIKATKRTNAIMFTIKK